MNMKQAIITVGLAVVATSSAYSAPKHKTLSHALIPPFIGSADSITGSCPSTNVKYVTLELGNLLKHLHEQTDPREIEHGDGTKVDKLQNLPPSHRATMLDMQLTRSGTHNDVVMLTVNVTTTSGIAFLVPTGQDPDKITDGSLAVMIPHGSTGFCGTPTISHNVSGGKMTNSVTIGVLPDAVAYRSLNINLLIPDSSHSVWLPLIIDPNVKNNG